MEGEVDMGQGVRKAAAATPQREHFYFVGAQEGGSVPLSGADLLLDANIVSFGEAILRNGYNPNAVQQRRFRHLIGWMSTFDAAGFMVFAGASEGADFDGYAVSPLKMAARVQAVESLINMALDHPEVEVFSGRRPLESFVVSVDYADIDHWAKTARRFFGMLVLPNYAVIAQWRLMIGSAHRGTRTPQQSRDLLIELLNWLYTEIGWIPLAWSWLCLAEFGTQPVSQAIVDGVFKINKPGVAAAINSAAWDCSLIGLMVSLQRPGRHRGSTVLVTDDEALSRAAAFILPIGQTPGFYRVDPDTIKPDARQAWSQVMHYRAMQARSRDRRPDRATATNDVDDAWTRFMRLVRSLQQQLGLDETDWYRDHLRVEQHHIDPHKLNHLLAAFDTANTAAELVRDPRMLSTSPDQPRLDIDDLLHVLSIGQYTLEVLGRDTFSEHFLSAASYAYPSCPPDRILELFVDPHVERAVELIYYWGTNTTAMQVAIENLLTPASRAERHDTGIQRHTIALTWGLLRVWQTAPGASAQRIGAEIAQAFAPQHPGG
ncbi:hypothetical protein [Mycolicibacterium sp.]|uniref:hypothetical protein n=1 Tax=Mycolicibacterium sp. TaxID=2320850 RepID=UPI0037C98E82